MQKNRKSLESIKKFVSLQSFRSAREKIFDNTERKVQAKVPRNKKSRALILLELKASGQAKNLKLYKEEFDPGSG